MKSILAGTAGHIDHGKTALVRALTGVDTDRLEEEKRRGISIDLGFAHLDLTPTLRLGFVDVPGHERFIKNMLAGVGGIDLVLFVIAADESIKPQTREHFDICRLLKIPKGIIALTKADVVDEDILELARLEAEEFVRGSFLEGAPIVPVSSVTGAGLPELRAHLQTVASSVEPKDRSRYFRLPIDRAFSLRGFGTVVTGTLVAGSIAPEDEIEIHPASRRARVRCVEVHGHTVPRAFAGERTALNLAGAEAADLARGMVLAEPGRFQPTCRVDAVFELLVSASPLKPRAPVHFHAGAAEIEAEARLFQPGPLAPGSRAYLQFLLRQPLLLLPGDRFIVRRFSPVVTIGGGVILDISPPAKLRAAEALSRLSILDTGSIADRLSRFVAESPYGLPMPALVARTGLLEREIEAAAGPGPFVVLREPQFWLLDREWVAARLEALRTLLRAFHRQNPLAAGMPKEELRSRELAGAPAFLLDALLRGARDLAADGDLLRLASHKVAFRTDEAEALSKIEAAFESAGLAVPATGDVLARSGVDAARARPLLQILLRDKRLVRAGDQLVFHRSALAALRGQLAAHRGERFGVAEFKEWTGVSRKYAIPLLEYLDREHVTRREGDLRLVL